LGWHKRIFGAICAMVIVKTIKEYFLSSYVDLPYLVRKKAETLLYYLLVIMIIVSIMMGVYTITDLH